MLLSSGEGRLALVDYSPDRSVRLERIQSGCHRLCEGGGAAWIASPLQVHACQ
jgi:hypothetical protein